MVWRPLGQGCRGFESPGDMTDTEVANARCLALWFPGWPITAWIMASGLGDQQAALVALVSANKVVACTAAAAAEGVRVGQRRREAQSRCPELRVLLADEARDSREFEPVVECVERLSPGVQLIRPGLCVVRARGLSGYLGAEELAAETVLEAVIAELGIASGRVGVADGVFTAVQAARQADPVHVVARGGSAEFLAPLPISGLGDSGLTELLPRLGVCTLGDFAGLSAADVRSRFGAQGVRLWGLAAGMDSRQVIPRVPPPELTKKLDFEPALTLVEQVAFAARTEVERFIAGLTDAGLVCTEVRLEFVGERDELCIRSWLSPASFDAAGLLDRIRWQLQAAAGEQLISGVVGLEIEPIAVAALASHAPGLFGLGPDEKVHHAMSRVQAMVGHGGVVTAQVGGGRWLAERQQLVAWGDRAAVVLPTDRPWPGRVPGPQPAAVFTEPLPVGLLDVNGQSVVVTPRGQLSKPPTGLQIDRRIRTLIGWAGPWPIAERGWDQERSRAANRCQVVDGTGTAWLLFADSNGWWAEARYD
jgi:protein ImuB